MYYLAKFFELIGIGVITLAFYVNYPDPMQYNTLLYGVIFFIGGWIIEKFFSWSDLKKGNINKIYSKDLLLTNIMIYILSKSFNTSSWVYFGRREEGGRNFPIKFNKIKDPTAIAEFPKEMSEGPPKSYVNRIFNVVRWTKMPRGGHFAALEEPELLIKDIKSFFKKI